MARPTKEQLEAQDKNAENMRRYRGAIHALIEAEMRVSACRALATFPDLKLEEFVMSARGAFLDARNTCEKLQPVPIAPLATKKGK